LSTLIVEKLISEEALAAWRQRWDELPNTFTDENAPMVPLLLASDAMLTDGVSFIGEYPVITGKPAIFWEKDQHWAFSRIGERAAETAIRVHSWDEVSHALLQAKACHFLASPAACLNATSLEKQLSIVRVRSDIRRLPWP
jgi:hypothetical protein